MTLKNLGAHQQETGAYIEAEVWICVTYVLANCLVSPVVRLIPIGTKDFMDR